MTLKYAFRPQHKKKVFYEYGPSEARFPTYDRRRLKKILKVSAEPQHRMLQVWTVTAWLAEKFEVLYGSSAIISVSLLYVLYITEFFKLNSGLQVFPQIQI
jgi:hypothetical protein